MSGSTAKEERRAALAEAEAKRTALPVCPHCGADPVEYSFRPLRVGNFACMSIFCSNLECRKLFGIEIVGTVPQPQPHVVPAGMALQ